MLTHSRRAFVRFFPGKNCDPKRCSHSLVLGLIPMTLGPVRCEQQVRGRQFRGRCFAPCRTQLQCVKGLTDIQFVLEDTHFLKCQGVGLLARIALPRSSIFPVDFSSLRELCIAAQTLSCLIAIAASQSLFIRCDVIGKTCRILSAVV